MPTKEPHVSDPPGEERHQSAPNLAYQRLQDESMLGILQHDVELREVQ